MSNWQRMAWPKVSHPNKFGAKRARGTSGRLYASKAERDRGDQLRLLEQAKVIRNLGEQPRIELEPGIFYRPDFVYVERGRLVYEDVKGVVTERFRLVCKLWRLHGPAVLRVTKRKGTRSAFIVVREIMGKGQG